MIDAKHLQRKVISDIFERLTPLDRIRLCDEQQRHRTGLERAIREVKQIHFPTFINISTIRRWIYHYLQHGETPVETRAREKKLRLNKRTRAWTREDLDELRKIVDEDPNLYLDEIQTMLLYSLDKVFSTSSIRRKLDEMGFTLKVAFEKAYQRDEEQRMAWRTFLMERGPDVVNHMIFVDETHKCARDSRRRRHRVLRGLSQPFYESYFFGENHDLRFENIYIFV